jgi:outer membrane protein assembly factor BamB
LVALAACAPSASEAPPSGAPNPIPIVTALTPARLDAGGAALALTVTGSGFVPASVVSWNGSERRTLYVSDGTVLASITAADLSVAGVASVTVGNPAPGGGRSPELGLLVGNPAPSATALFPGEVAAGDPPFTLAVHGSGFVSRTVVRWNGADRPTTVSSDQVLHAAIDAADVESVGSAAITVYTPPPLGGTADAGAVTITPPAPPPSRTVTYQVDPTHGGRVVLGSTRPYPVDPAWSVTVAGPASYPIVAGGKAFVLSRASASGGYGEQLYALDLATGAIAWGPVDLPGTFYWGALAYDGGTLFALDFEGQLRTFDAASGAPGWSVDLPAAMYDSAPTARDGVVFVAGGGGLRAVDERDGTVLWSVAIDGIVETSPAVTAAGVFVAPFLCSVNAFGLDGSPAWNRDLGCSSAGGSTPVYHRGALLVRERGVARAGTILDARHGATLGHFGDSEWLPMPAVAAGKAFFVWGGALQAYDLATSALLWSFVGDAGLVSAPLVVDGGVVVGSSSGTVYAVDLATGVQQWAGSAGAAIAAPDEWNASQPLTGLGAGEGYLVVPAGNRITAWRVVAP